MNVGRRVEICILSNAHRQQAAKPPALKRSEQIENSRIDASVIVIMIVIISKRPN